MALTMTKTLHKFLIQTRPYVYLASLIMMLNVSVLFLSNLHAQTFYQSNIVLLVHGITVNPQKNKQIWGKLNHNSQKKNQWSGMIGFLQNKKYRFGGTIETNNLSFHIDKEGVIYNKKQANLYSFEFSRAAATDGIAYKCIDLSTCIKELVNYTHCKQISIVAYSAGGLIVRSYLQKALPLKETKYIKYVKKLITICTPHFGSTPAKYLGDILGTRATSLKPDAQLIINLNNKFQLPPNVLFASIVVRGFAADARGNGDAYDKHIDLSRLKNLPLDFKYGGDQVVHVKSQNLYLAKCSQKYEQKTQQPILFPLVRVVDPTPDYKLLFGELVHTAAPNEKSVQNIVFTLLDSRNLPWKKKKNKIDKQAIASMKQYTESVIEYNTLAKHKFHEVQKIHLTQFKKDQKFIYRFSGYALSQSYLSSWFLKANKKTEINGKIEFRTDTFGRVIYCKPANIQVYY